MQDLSEFILGKTETPLPLLTAEDNRHVALTLARQARRRLLLFTHDLDTPVLGTPEFAEAVSRLVRRHPHNHCHILVRDSTDAALRGHRLVDLAQRLSSRVKIHNPLPEYDGRLETFLIVDDVGYLRRKQWNRYEGEALFAAVRAARDLANLFEAIWERSWPDPHLRALSI